jgi:hypothetical protein
MSGWLIRTSVGELGFGTGQPKSVLQPQQMQTLAGTQVYQCAFTSFVRAH